MVVAVQHAQQHSFRSICLTFFMFHLNSTTIIAEAFAVVFGGEGRHHPGILATLYDVSLNSFPLVHPNKSNDDDDNVGEDESDSDDDDDDDDEKPRQIGESHVGVFFETFKRFGLRLQQCQWLKLLVGEQVSLTSRNAVVNHVKRTCAGRFDKRLFGSQCTWLSDVVMPWVMWALCPDGVAAPHLYTIQQQLLVHLYDSFAALRIDEMFNIIVDFPESHPALLDLRECLAPSEQRSHTLHRSLRLAFERRLLQPGANTSDILSQYINAIRSLRILDSTGTTLELVCEPVRAYLRKRRDTIRCIITLLLDESSDLINELDVATTETTEAGAANDATVDVTAASGAASAGGDAAMAADTSAYAEMMAAGDDSDGGGDDWVPDPIDVPHGGSVAAAYASSARTAAAHAASMGVGGSSAGAVRERRAADIVSLLVNIYRSQELFVKEYRALLADRLLSALDFSTTREARNVELLKLRFGEGNLLQCEVMLKDIADSKRINGTVHSMLEERGVETATINASPAPVSIPLDVTVLSRLFWPSFRDDDFQPHRRTALAMEQYNAAYGVLKAGRTLAWKPSVGSVDLELELEDRTVALTVPASLANLIMLFEDRPSWSLAELVTTMRLPSSAMRKRVDFWIGKGVLVEKSVGVFAVVEKVVAPAAGDTASTLGKKKKKSATRTATKTSSGAGGVGTAAAQDDDNTKEEVEKLKGDDGKEEDEDAVDDDDDDDDEEEEEEAGEDEDGSGPGGAAEFTDDVLASAADEKEKEMDVYWSYVVGMLTNLGACPIDRIHQMLGVFVQHG